MGRNNISGISLVTSNKRFIMNNYEQQVKDYLKEEGLEEAGDLAVKSNALMYSVPLWLLMTRYANRVSADYQALILTYRKKLSESEKVNFDWHFNVHIAGGETTND